MSRYEDPETREIAAPSRGRLPRVPADDVSPQGTRRGQLYPPRRPDPRERVQGTLPRPAAEPGHARPPRPPGPPRPERTPQASQPDERTQVVKPQADAPTQPVLPPVDRRPARPDPVPPPEPDEVRPGTDALQDPPEEPPAPRTRHDRGGAARAVVRTFGEVLITLGVVVLLFVVYELWVTNLMSQELQRDASADLDQRWSQQREMHTEPMDGEAFARMYIPSFGVDWNFTIQQGVDAATLEIGPGHYKKTAMPGEPGNFAVAGHRVGKGAPFNDLDLLGSCDAVVIETLDSFFVYRVLPMSDEVQGWAQGKGSDPRCAGVRPLAEIDPAYGETVGRRIVLPTRGDAVAPVPYRADATLTGERQVELLTLTTCHPRFSDRERMIIHGVLTNVYEKRAGATYEQLLQEIGEA